MTTLVGSSAGSTHVRGPRSTDANFTLASTLRDHVISAGGSSDSTIQDAVIRASTTATVDHEFDAAVTETVPGSADNLTFESVDTGIATVNSQGIVTRVADGTALIDAVGRLLRKRVRVYISRQVGTTANTFLNFASGSLGAHCATAVDSRIAALTPSVVKPIFSAMDHAGNSYTRNASTWLTSLDITCLSVWNSVLANKGAGTLITPRHIAFANHYAITDGATLRFVTSGNVVVTRTLSSQLNVAGTDIQIGKLDSDVPGTISFAKVLPANYATYLPGIAYGVPTVSTDQDKNAMVGVLYYFSTIANFRYPTVADRLAMNEPIVLYDSGAPAFLIINNELVLVTTWNFGAAGSGPNIANYITQINAALSTLGGGYTLTTASMAGFTAF
jgi:hypothetical protein